ncbi:D-glycero-beta-D-manno-heptose 1-phosphate adenylyltransferase [Mycolicibacterium sp. ELW1]|uniref:D-glycero-beta-D-manno-heptose 1-phosphate adenylyltransferase n=1 Tax=Mycobacteriaceae TaxID=1762 RepID=UPI0011EBCE2B|nr:D-glycero-beta-D-manno-heptose 1-phosphate adenylyltransferase [Mycobacterium sp. ELW1]QEN12690.1 D-glycero-beta-D-manno-heptose 1-phosphate adenylyltransferase [Mycobacterium sp. ELW1]
MNDSQGFLDFDASHLAGFIERFPEQHIVVVGDVMLDSFVYGDAQRISPEAPVPVLRFSSEMTALGGAGNVVRNISAFDADVACVGVVGDDVVGREVEALLSGQRGVTCALVRMPGRPTTTKVRYLAAGQQVVRVDREELAAIDSTAEDEVIAAVKQQVRDGSLIILADYAKGVLTRRVLDEIIAFARAKGVRTVVEPKSADFARYRHAHLIIGNASEIAAATRMPTATDTDVHAATREAQRLGDFQAVITTRSEKGVVALDDNSVLHSFPARAQQVFDVSGAGDTVTATVALMLATGASLAEAAYIANEAASIVVSKLGTSVTSADELKARLQEDDGVNYADKIASLDDMLARVLQQQRTKRRVGFTNGVFDILHVGHLSLLAQARVACDYLVVAINSDDSVRRLKGPERPINTEHDRALLLAALEMVDGVVMFGEDTPLRVIETLKPDLLVKGADYRREQIVGGDFVERRGGRVVIANLVGERSTTRTIDRIRRQAEKADS